MTKLLFLSITGNKFSDENPRYLNAFFASFKKHVLPYFDCKILLFDTSNYSEDIKLSKTQEKINDYELSSVIKLFNVDTIGIKNEAFSFLKECDWFHGIGHVMNTIFDKAKKNHFFECDWVFHTDTDVAFSKNFKDFVVSMELLKKTHEKILISVAGDAYPAIVKNNEFQIQINPPERVSLFDENFIFSHGLNSVKATLQVSKNIDALNHFPNKISVYPPQYKIRNDFFGMSKQAAASINPNWVSYNIPEEFSETISEVSAFSSNDKGTIVFYDIKEGFKFGYNDCFHIQVPTEYLHTHFASGLSGAKDNFIEKSFDYLNSEFLECESLWKKDYDK